MIKGLEALERLNNIVAYDENGELIPIDEDLSIIKKELKDFEWLKSKINIDFFYQLSSEDRVKLAEILEVELWTKN